MLFFSESANGELMHSMVALSYPKAGPLGGALIRKVIAFLKSQGFQIPVTSHILIAISGGSDSVGLAHLLIHLGRRIAPKTQVSLLHVNHGWRGEESNQDEAFIHELGAQWGVPVVAYRVNGLAQSSGVSWEEEARRVRKEIFKKEASQREAVVFTAHQADDLAETLLWRIFTGAAHTHGGGISFQHEVEVRPFLKVRKTEIQSYLQEVGVPFREDSTNGSDRFLRARMRQRLMPEVEKLFPQALGHLVALALQAQELEKGQTKEPENQKMSSLLPFEMLFRAAGLKVRRSHFEFLLEKESMKEGWSGEIHLPEGWKLIREKKKTSRPSVLMKSYNQESFLPSKDRWVLERF